MTEIGASSMTPTLRRICTDVGTPITIFAPVACLTAAAHRLAKSRRYLLLGLSPAWGGELDFMRFKLELAAPAAGDVEHRHGDHRQCEIEHSAHRPGPIGRRAFQRFTRWRHKPLPWGGAR